MKRKILKALLLTLLTISLITAFYTAQGYLAINNSMVFHYPDCKWAKRMKEEKKYGSKRERKP
jgi:hypothetical protein